MNRGKMKSGSRRKSAARNSSVLPTFNLNIKPSTLAIYLLVFVNCVLIFSSAHKLFKKTVATSIEARDEQPLKIEVQNGCGVTGLAKKFATNLEYLNYEIIGTGNADHHNYEQTILLYPKMVDEKAVGKLCKDIGIQKDDSYELDFTGESDEKSGADVRLIIGKDYQSLKIFNILP